MIKYTINHYVTVGDGSMDSSVHGDNALCVWVNSDPTTDDPDHTHEQPSDGWSWTSNMSGWQQHPEPLSEYVSDASEIERLDPWDTSLTDGVQK